MSRTGLSAADLAKSLRAKAGDGSVEWCYEPMQVSVLLDIADMLAENARLQEVVDDGEMHAREILDENARLRELLAGVGHLLFILDVDYCVACPRDSINHPCPVYTVNGGECLYKTDMCELGIEV